MKSLVVLVCAVLATSGIAAQAPRGTVRVPPRPAFADSIATAVDAPIRFRVLDAEAEGAQWVRRSEPTFQVSNHGVDDFGIPAPRTCVTTESSAPIRSGDFVVGGQLGGAAAGSGQVKIWWEPMHPAEGFSLVVRGARLGPVKDTLRYVQKEWAIGGSAGQGTIGPVFYAS